MNYAYYQDNFSDKMQELLNKHYPDIHKSKRRKKFINKYDREYRNSEDGKTIESSVKNWMNPNIASVPTLEQLINICNLYNVDISYFLTEQKEYNSKVDEISDYLDMSKESINRLMQYNQAEIKMLDNLISVTDTPSSTDNLKPLLQTMLRYKSLTQSIHTEITIKNDAFDYFAKPDAPSVLRYDVTQALEKCLNSPSFVVDKVTNVVDKIHICKEESMKKTRITRNKKTITVTADIAEIYYQLDNSEKDQFFENQLTQKKKR